MNPTRRALVSIVMAVAVAFVVGLVLWLSYPGLFLGPAVAGLFVAGGTGALAASAYYTIEWDREKHEEEKKWREQLRFDRRQDREPHIEILAGERMLPKRVAAGDRTAKTEVVDFQARTLVLRNNGPGIAANFKAVRTVRFTPADVLNPPPGPPDPEDYWPRSRDHAAKDETKVDSIDRVYLRAGEDVVLSSPDEWSKPLDPLGDETYAVLWNVTCTDLDGNPAQPARGGLQEYERLTERESPAEDIEWDKEYHHTRSRWYFVSELKSLPKKPPRLPETGDTEVSEWE